MRFNHNGRNIVKITFSQCWLFFSDFLEIPHCLGRRSRSKKATFQQQDECSPGYNEPDQGESHFSFDPNVVDPKQKKRRAVTDEREMKNIRIKKRLRLDSYHKNHNLRSQVINLNKKSGGILKRLGIWKKNTEIIFVIYITVPRSYGQLIWLTKIFKGEMF